MGFRLAKIFLTSGDLQVTFFRCQSQTLKSLKSNISKTVRDREKVSIEDTYEVTWAFKSQPKVTSEGQSQNLRSSKSNNSNV